MDLFIHVSLLKTLLFACIGLPCAIYDLETCRAPRANLLFLIFVLIAATPLEALSTSLFGATSGIAIFYLVRKLTGDGLGLADVWMAGAIGALGGPVFFALSCLAAILLTLPRTLFLVGRKSRQAIPFLPSLLAGSFFLLLADIFTGKN